MTVRHRIEQFDTSLFDSIESQSTDADRRSLLALHAAIAAEGPFSYLEIGSHLGGSLQALIRDERCTYVLSIDPRPALQPDNQGPPLHFPENSTERMVGLLANVPGADLSKLVTYEASTRSLQTRDLPTRPAFCFIDGEHTDVAALRDARFCREALADNGIIAFHDSLVVRRAIAAFMKETAHEIACAAALPEHLFAVEYGRLGLLRSVLGETAYPWRWQGWLWTAANVPLRNAFHAWPIRVAWLAERTHVGARRRLRPRRRLREVRAKIQSRL